VTSPRVSVVVLNWNNLGDTLDCLRSLAMSSYQEIRVILIDNHSDEDPTATVSAHFPEIRIERQRRNLGFSGGCNAGIVLALQDEAEYVLLLNNDAFVTNDMIARLVDVGERHPEAASVTPTIRIHGSERIYWDGGTIDWSRGDTMHDSSSLPTLEDGVRESGWSNGCALLLRAKTIREIGVLDDQFFLYFEDTDWSVRASRLGWRHLVVLDAICWHKVARSFGGPDNPVRRYYYVRNRYRLLAKHAPGHSSMRSTLLYFKRVLGDYHWYRKDVQMRRAVLHGALDSARNRWGEHREMNAGFMAVCDSIAYLVTTAGMALVTACRRAWRIASVQSRGARGRES